MPAGTLLDLVDAAARDAPARIALRAPGRADTSFGALAEHVRELGDRLAGHGVSRTDRVVVALPDGVDAAVAILATTAAAVAVPLSTMTPAEEAGRLLDRLQPRAVIVPRAGGSAMAEAARARGGLVIEAESPQEPSGLVEWPAGGAGGSISAAGPEHAAVVLHTSGTTSEARRVVLSHGKLVSAGRLGTSVLALGPDDFGLNFAPLFHLAGLYYALVYPLSARSGVFVTPGFDAARFVAWFQAARPTYFGGSPTAHHAILDQIGAATSSVRGTRLRFIRTAAAALPLELQARLEATFEVPVLDGYALTEAGLVTSAGLDPATRRLGTVGRPVGDARVRIVDANGEALEAGARGEIVLRGSRVMGGYDGDPEATRQAFFGDWLRTGDEGSLDADGFLIVTGRLRERVNRGGEKVAPREVEDALASHPAVRESAAFGIPHPRLGEDLAVVVALRPDAAASAAELRTHVAGRLAPFKVPSRVFFRERVPRGPTGKVPRARLAEVLALESRGLAPARPVGDERSEEERAMCERMADVLGRAVVGIDDDFFDLGGDSISAAALVVRIAIVHRIELPPSALFGAPSPRALTRLLEGTRAGGRRTPLVPLVAVGVGAPVFFVHAIGGGALFLRELAKRLGDRPFYGLQAPGFDGRESPATGVEELAGHYVEAICERFPEGPYVVGGFCMGAAVAFEMARQFEARDRKIETILMLDPPPLPVAARARLRDRVRRVLTTGWERVRGVPPELFDPKESPVAHAHRRAVRRYRPGRIAAPLSIVFTIEAQKGLARDALYTLRRLTSGPISVDSIPGTHADLLREPAVEEAGSRLRSRLAELCL